MERTITITSSTNQLAATLHYPAMDANQPNACPRYPAVIICHGFVGNRIGTDRLFVHAARRMSEAGYFVIRFDYAGCGESTGDYGQSGIGQLVDQTRDIITYALSVDCIDPSRLHLIGHSLGGAVALITAANDKRVKNLAMWSAVAHPYKDISDILGRARMEQIFNHGETDFSGYNFKRSYFDSLLDYQPLHTATQFGGDVLILHGTYDDVISVDYAYIYERMFWNRAFGQAEKELITQADHTFSVEAHRNQLIQRTLTWLEDREKHKRDWNGWMI